MNLVEKTLDIFSACKRKDDSPEHPQQPKKPRLVFTDLQRRTLQAIFKVNFCTSIQIGGSSFTINKFFLFFLSLRIF